MDDLERYGDYNEIEEPPSKNKILVAIRIVIALAIIAIVAILGFRIVLYNYYPAAATSIYVDQKLIDLYNSKNGELGAKTQELMAPYDDAKTGSLFCSNLIVIEDMGDGLGRVQITMRYNFSAIEYIQNKYNISGLDPKGEGVFDFALYRVDATEDELFTEDDKVGTLIEADYSTLAMYGYYKLVFDGVKLTGEGAPSWLSLAVSVKAVEQSEPFGRILIYQKGEKYATFSDYEVKASDLKAK